MYDRFLSLTFFQIKYAVKFMCNVDKIYKKKKKNAC